jgi:hypothetical protein
MKKTTIMSKKSAAAVRLLFRKSYDPLLVFCVLVHHVAGYRMHAIPHTLDTADGAGKRSV